MPVVYKPDINSIKEGFGTKLATKIITKLMHTDTETVTKNLEKGFVVLIIDGQEVVLTDSNFMKIE